MALYDAKQRQQNSYRHFEPVQNVHQRLGSAILRHVLTGHMVATIILLNGCSTRILWTLLCRSADGLR